MAHDTRLIPLPLPPPPDDDEFDTSDVTKTRATFDALAERVAEMEQGWQAQLRSVSLELTIIGREVRETKQTGDKVIDEIRKLTKLILEERAERFALGDRVSNLEQPRTKPRKGKK